MVQHGGHYRKRTLDFSDKHRNLAKFTTDVEHFLEEFDKVVQHRQVYRRDYARHLREIEANLKLLISKFHRIEAGGSRNQLFWELFCCGTLFENCDELRRHYFRFHNTTRLVHPNIVELQSGHGKLEHFRRRLQEYLNYGTEYSAVLLVNLQKLLSNVSHTIQVDNAKKDDGCTKPDYQIFRWRDFTPKIERFHTKIKDC
ncbi:AAEL010164-PA [Aedes aegypti]|uniref:AAEL010164-PA n=1 Tax=Aedes aegypti TaxID=7159 RepID=Q16TP0_AEDAE|nr:AAEL010164-PA [Aedes aegypti]